MTQNMAMHGYYFAARVTRGQIVLEKAGRGMTAMRPQVWTGCDAGILYASDQASAQKRFEVWLNRPPENGGNYERVSIEQIVFTPILDQILTETGNQPADWLQLDEQFRKDMEAAGKSDDPQVEYFEQGYWLDPATEIRPGPGIDALRNALPEDIRSGLNWSADKQFYFLITIFALPPAPAYDPDTGLPVGQSKAEEDLPETETDEAGTGETGVYEQFLPMADKETVVAVRARNAAVAIWLWRKYSARGKLENNPIHLDQWRTGIE